MAAGNDVTTQVMMTLAGLAGNAAVERPSGEFVADQEARIFKGIEKQLQDKTLATGGLWQPIWLGLTRDRANLAYIAQNLTIVPAAPQYAIVLRGTAFSMSVDVAEDMKVGVLLPFESAGGGAHISQGSMRAFTEIVTAVCHPGVSPVRELAGTTLVDALQLLLGGAVGPSTIYVTGHSLGGAMATTLALYLKTVRFGRQPAAIQVYTFAAPTAGDGGFASGFNTAFPSAVCVWNKYDAVPNAWWNLVNKVDPAKGVDHFFPPLKGPVANPVVKDLVKSMAAKAAAGYTQPAQQPALNPNYTTYDHEQTGTSTKDWLGQVAFQHQNNTYLELLGATKLGDFAPRVSANGIDPRYCPRTGGIVVTISGANFTPDSAVDFGVVPGKQPVASADGKTITVTAPQGVGIVDVTVTTMFGTSPADIANDQFAYVSTS